MLMEVKMPTKNKKKWIPKDLNKGAFTKKAKAAGMSAQEFADKVTKPGSKADSKTKKQANLAKTFSKIAKKRKN